jgi:hypothetical protein
MKKYYNHTHTISIRSTYFLNILVYNTQTGKRNTLIKNTRNFKMNHKLKLLLLIVNLKLLNYVQGSQTYEDIFKQNQEQYKILREHFDRSQEMNSWREMQERNREYDDRSRNRQKTDSNPAYFAIPVVILTVTLVIGCVCICAHCGCLTTPEQGCKLFQSFIFSIVMTCRCPSTNKYVITFLFFDNCPIVASATYQQPRQASYQPPQAHAPLQTPSHTPSQTTQFNG